MRSSDYRTSQGESQDLKVARPAPRAITGGVQGGFPILNALGELSWAFIYTLLICIYMIKKDTDYSLIMQGKVQNRRNWWSLAYAWIWNKLIVLNLILCWFCSNKP